MTDLIVVSSISVKLAASEGPVGALDGARGAGLGAGGACLPAGAGSTFAAAVGSGSA